MTSFFSEILPCSDDERRGMKKLKNVTSFGRRRRGGRIRFALMTIDDEEEG